MITINLLPDEYRRRAKSPVGMIAAVAGAVLVNASLIAYWGYLEFGISRNIETTRSVLQLDLDGLKPQVAYHEKLKNEISVRSARETTLAEITQNRVLWTKVMDELIDVVHAGREGIEHFVWFDDIDVKMLAAARGRTTSFGSLSASAHSGSEGYDQVSNFLDDMNDTELTSLGQIFGKTGDPEGTRNAPEKDLIPAVNWSFP
ncbi:MAG: hypothetical protein AAGG01_24430, partial [Planctomycetota bacterium]